MGTLSKFASTAALALATTLVLSCSSDDSNDNNSTGGGMSSGGGASSPSGGNVESVTIGTQVWMKKNLDVAGGKCYDELQANCDKYGALYDWATAMGLAASCNESECAEQVQTKHKGICPSGWHIPTRDEWNTLIDYAGDEDGFAALLGGIGFNGSFQYVEERGYWWTSSEGRADRAYSAKAAYNRSGVFGSDTEAKIISQSVRCIKD